MNRSFNHPDALGAPRLHQVRLANRNKINNKVMGQNRNRLDKAKIIAIDPEIDRRTIEKNLITKKLINGGTVVEEDTHAVVPMKFVIKIAIMKVKTVGLVRTIANINNITKTVVKLIKILKKAFTKIEAAKFVPKTANQKREKLLAIANNPLPRKKHPNKRLSLTKLPLI